METTCLVRAPHSPRRWMSQRAVLAGKPVYRGADACRRYRAIVQLIRGQHPCWSGAQVRQSQTTRNSRMRSCRQMRLAIARHFGGEHGPEEDDSRLQIEEDK